MLSDISTRHFWNEKIKRDKNIICIWYMNIGCESIWRGEENNIIPSVSNKNNQSIINGTEQLCLLMAKQNDVVILRESPPEIVLNSIRKIGFKGTNIWRVKNDSSLNHKNISELILMDLEILEQIRRLKYENEDCEVLLIPYAVTYLDEEIARITGCSLYSADNNIVTWVNSKVNCRLLADDIGLNVPFGFICKGINETVDVLNKMYYEYKIEKFVVKEEYGASGKGFYIIDSSESLEFFKRFILRGKKSKINVKLLIEKWYETLMDINYQLFIDSGGEIYYIEPKEQIIKNGIYLGSKFLKKDDLPAEKSENLKYSALKIGRKLSEIGYYGVASIDCILTRDGNIYPMIEINGRFSLSTYISFLPDEVIKNRSLKCKYYNICGENHTEVLLGKIEDYSFNEIEREGIIVYSFTKGRSNLCNSRIFMLLIAKDDYMLEDLEKRIDSIIV
ncbi:ATP-binding protein [Clostridium tertium]|uniref:ATP-binding protein n=1 Tax=Clostridium tertium TaxID=1559 RepID=UPI0024B32B15|nr:ATP-grasp domain-containing protein [Clostridium tertium]MDI9216424.1 ATP-grasp domain-containing protein [Clostridium tertium]